MGVLDVLGLGKAAGEAIATPVEAVGNVIDKLFTSDEERAAAEAVMEKLRQEPYLLQAEINKLEAQHSSLFVAGWRPAVGWIGALAIGWHFVGFDLTAWACAMWWPTVTPPRLVGTENLLELVLALLGLGTMRTVEKARRVAK